MQKFSKKLVAILLTLLLAFSPIQAAFAGMVILLDEGQDLTHQNHHASMKSKLISDEGMQNTHDCCQITKAQAPCGNDNNCKAQSCLNGHCATCVTAVVPELIDNLLESSAVKHISVSTSVITFSPLTLYRPPKV